MTNQEAEQKELLGILQEECAEVIQVVSKINRFGLLNVHNGKNNLERLHEEVGDVLAVVVALNLRHPDLLNDTQLEQAIRRKIAKLKKYVPSMAEFDLDEASKSK